MDMSGKTAIVAGLGVSGQSMMEVLGSRAEKVLGVDEKKPDADLHSFDHIDWDACRLGDDFSGIQSEDPVHSRSATSWHSGDERGRACLAAAGGLRCHWASCAMDWHHRYQWQDLHYGNDFGDVDGLRFDRTCCRQYRQSGVPCRSRSGK